MGTATDTIVITHTGNGERMARNQMVAVFGKRIRTKSAAPFMIVIRRGLTGTVGAYGYAYSEDVARQRVARAKANSIDGSDFAIVPLR
jgi:hypothetical protein